MPRRKHSKTARPRPEEKEESESEGRGVGLDQGKRNIVTMVCENNKRLRYTTAQRNFQSGLTRYREVLLKEKRSFGVEAAEPKLSKLFHRTCDFLQYTDYLKVEADTDALNHDFYLQKKWRGWKLREGRAARTRC